VKEAQQMRIMLHTTEQGRKNQNHAAERKIGFLAKLWLALKNDEAESTQTSMGLWSCLRE
jgi:hypothetical protein